jgi:methylglutaconyl-CoA hydratase
VASGRATTSEATAGVATITLNRPDDRNALSEELLASLREDLSRAATDQSCRVVVITNSGPAFSAGADLKGKRRASGAALGGVLEAIMGHPKPVVARVAGHCAGGGVGLAAACDVSVAASDVTFAFREVRVGVAPAVISVVCLQKMRRGDALELFLSGEAVTAERAVEVGLVNRAVERSRLDEEISALVASLLEGAPAALRAAKRLVSEVPRLGEAEGFEMTAALSDELFASDEAAEGLAAFRQRRPAAWSPSFSRPRR